MENRENGVSMVPQTMLIVDDDFINRSILENIFSSYYRIEEAEDGEEGLDKILRNPERLCAVLLDVVMPRMNGIEVLRQLQEKGLTEKIPVFLITAEASDSVMKEGYQLGVMDVIGKPVVPYIVLRRVQSVVELFRARERLSNVVELQQSELLEKARRIVELNQGMIEALAAAIEFRDGESGEHVRRIHDITKYMLLNTEMGRGFSQESVENIALAAIMHDVGKVAIPDAILNKPGKLTPEEYEIMKTHTLRGAELLERIPQLKDQEAYQYAYDIARHHHERWDGNGYPDGLKGDENTIWAQIVSIADVYDALVSRRVYKDAYGADTAVRMIQNGECGAFNPLLLEQFMSVEKDLRALYVKDVTENG